MKTNKILWYLIVFTLIFNSCRIKDNNKVSKDEEINQWIYENMYYYYYWSKELPQNINYKQSPNDFFYSLLHKDDRFSWIQENYTDLLNSLSGITNESGYDYNLLSTNDNKIIGYITYVKENTPASEKLKRGMFFNRINGEVLEQSNYSEIIKKIKQKHKLGLINLDSNTFEYTEEGEIELDVIQKYAENPIHFYKIYTVNDKKIGYLVYNLFSRGQRSSEYEVEMNEIFKIFKDSNINEFILDLRYNGGGSVYTSQVLASLISGRGKDDIYCYDEFNDILTDFYTRNYGEDYMTSYFLDEITYEKETIQLNKLSNLSRIYILTSRRTASASELIINTLRPYFGPENVKIIGGKTYGKNVGSYTIYETNERKQANNKWGMQPIVLKLSNKEHFSDYGNGFSPDIDIIEHKFLPMKELGDTEEIMLKTAINDILGKTSIEAKNFTNNWREILGGSEMRAGGMEMYVEKNR